MIIYYRITNIIIAQTASEKITIIYITAFAVTFTVTELI